MSIWLEEVEKLATDAGMVFSAKTLIRLLAKKIDDLESQNKELRCRLGNMEEEVAADRKERDEDEYGAEFG